MVCETDASVFGPPTASDSHRPAVDGSLPSTGCDGELYSALLGLVCSIRVGCPSHSTQLFAVVAGLRPASSGTCVSAQLTVLRFSPPSPN